MLKGTLDDFTLPDIFRLLSFTKKTGKLEVVRSAGDGNVFFRDGDVYYAVSSLKREPLGQKLIRSGALTEGQLRKALDLNAATGERVGEILLRQGAISEEQLINGVRGQIEDAAFDLLRWETGDFVFESHERFNVEIPISVSVENLIMEASRRTDELETVRRKIPSSDVVLSVAPAPPEGAREINITPDEWRFLVLVDGVRSVGEIMEMAGADEFNGLRTLFGLLSSGLVDVASLGPVPETAELPDLPDAARPNAAVKVPDAPIEAEQAEDEAGAPEAHKEIEPVVEVDELETEAHEEIEPVVEVDERETEAPFVSSEALEEQPEPLESIDVEADAEDELSPAGYTEGEFGSEETLESLFGDQGESFEAPVVSEETSEHQDEPEVELQPRSEEYFAPDPEDSFEFEALTAPDEPAAEEAASEDWFQAPDFPDVQEQVSEVAEQDRAADAFLTDMSGEEEAETDAPAEAPAPVDRAAVVRELADLFSDDVRPRRPKAPSEPEAEDAEDDDEDGRRRVEDDDQVNRKLINRLIDGVKGL